MKCEYCCIDVQEMVGTDKVMMSGDCADQSSLRCRMNQIFRIKSAKSERRERIAVAALQGLLSNSACAGSPAEFATDACSQADALIAELDRAEVKS